jgi:ribosomal protein S18 acetylase RimI-like enzyme
MKSQCIEEYSKLAKEDLSLSSKQIRESFTSSMDNKKIILLLFEGLTVKGYLEGMILRNAHKIIGYIDDIFVDKLARNKGFATQLINEFTKWANQYNSDVIRLGVRVNNSRAINLYKKLGFTVKTDFVEMERGV